MPLNPYQKYKQQSVMTMTQGEMLLKLYDEAIKQMNSAVLFIEKKEISKRNAALQKSQRIVNYLRTTLNFSVEISNNLDLLYDYFNRKLIEANTKNVKEPILEILPMFTELRDTFEQADKKTRGML